MREIKNIKSADLARNVKIMCATHTHTYTHTHDNTIEHSFIIYNNLHIVKEHFSFKHTQKKQFINDTGFTVARQLEEVQSFSYTGAPCRWEAGPEPQARS